MYISTFVSTPEPKAQVHYCDHALSVVRPSLLFTFSTSPLKRLNRIKQNLTGSKISTPSTKFVFFGPIGKTRWPPWSLIGWAILDFSSETTEGNSTKLDRKQDLNVLYQVCVFRADPKNKMAALASDWRDIFDFSSETAERNSTKLNKKQDLNVLYQVCVFRANRKNKMTALADSSKRLHIVLRCKICDPLGLLLILVIPPKGRGRDERTRKMLFENKMAALASDWLWHFRLLLLNCWTEFNKSWQETRSHCPLPSLFFFRADRKNKMAALASDGQRQF